MRSLPTFPRSYYSASLILGAVTLLSACGGGLDPSYSRGHKFATSAPLNNTKKDPSFLAYAVPETELHKFPATRSAEFPVHGIDVSKYQGDIDWGQVKDSGVAFAFIKATEGAIAQILSFNIIGLRRKKLAYHAALITLFIGVVRHMKKLVILSPMSLLTLKRYRLCLMLRRPLSQRAVSVRFTVMRL